MLRLSPSVLVFALFLRSPVVNAAAGALSVRAHLSLRGSAAVPLGGPVALFYQVHNDGPSEVVIEHAGFWPNHMVEARHFSGEEVPLTALGQRRRDAFASRGGRDKAIPWRIGPGGVDTLEGPIVLGDLFDLSRPGSYSVRVRYEGAIGVASNDVRIHVLPVSALEVFDRLNGSKRSQFEASLLQELRRQGVKARWEPTWRQYVVLGWAGEGPELAGHLVAALRNDHVRWDGTTFGLVATPLGAPAIELLRLGPVAIPALLEAVGDPARFAAAHVLLTRIAGLEFSTGGSVWNGMTVELEPSGEVRFPLEERLQLQQRWRAWAARGTRPGEREER